MIFFIAMLTFFLEGKIIGMKPIKQAFFLCKAFLVFLNEDSLCASYLILNADFFFFFCLLGLPEMDANTHAFHFSLYESKITILIHYLKGQS